MDDIALAARAGEWKDVRPLAPGASSERRGMALAHALHAGMAEDIGLLQSDADVNALVTEASQNGYWDLVRYFAQCADPTVRAKAVERALRDGKGDLICEMGDDDTALLVAARSGAWEVARRFVDGASPKARGWALAHAMMQDELGVAGELRANDADRGCALIEAASNAAWGVAERLADDASPRARGVAVAYAAHFGDDATVTSLTSRDITYDPALYEAARNGFWETVLSFVEFSTTNGRSWAFAHAMQECCDGAVLARTELVRAGVDHDVALTTAARFQLWKAARILCSDATARGRGKAYAWACMHGERDILAMLSALGVDYGAALVHAVLKEELLGVVHKLCYAAPAVVRATVMANAAARGDRRLIAVMMGVM